MISTSCIAWQGMTSGATPRMITSRILRKRSHYDGDLIAAMLANMFFFFFLISKKNYTDWPGLYNRCFFFFFFSDILKPCCSAHFFWLSEVYPQIPNGQKFTTGEAVFGGSQCLKKKNRWSGVKQLLPFLVFLYVFSYVASDSTGWKL